MKSNTQRNLSLDILRIIACFVVILYHSRTIHINENGASFGILINNASQIAAFFIGRLGVPIFLLIGGYFGFPEGVETFSFLKKRLGRIVIPAAFWLLISTLCIGSSNAFFDNIWNLSCAGHLWYIYTLIGILFVIPLINPFLQNATKKELSLYLVIWLFTLVFNTNYFPSIAPYELTNYGMCASNPILAFINFYGYFGYYLLGFIVRKFLIRRSIYLMLPVLSIVVYASSVLLVGISVTNMYKCWMYLSIPVVLMSLFIFITFCRLNINYIGLGGVILAVSKLTFGAYLVHCLVLHYIQKIDYFLHVNVLFTAIVAFSTSMALTYFISMLPFKKYIIG